MTKLTPEAVPAPVRQVLDRLRAAGHAVHLVGGCVRDLLLGHEVQDFDLATSASPAQVLALFPSAVPIGLRHGTVMVPTGGRPVDVTRWRGGPRLEDDLLHRDFTINALAYDPVANELVDPAGGRRDLEEALLRCPGDPVARLAEDAVRALRAARFVATLDLEVDPALEAALPGARRALDRVAPTRLRRELELLLLGARAGRGLELLRRTGLEAALAPGTRVDAPAVVDAAPPVLELRAAAWLRGARAGRILARLRFGRRTSGEVTKLLLHHPIEQALARANEPRLRRFVARTGEGSVEALFTLREAELRARGETHGPAAESLRELRQALERAHDHERLALHRHELALDGGAVMRILGCPAGPRVGRALRFLTEQVLDDPTRNTPEGLEARLRAWAEREA